MLLVLEAVLIRGVLDVKLLVLLSGVLGVFPLQAGLADHLLYLLWLNEGVVVQLLVVGHWLLLSYLLGRVEYLARLPWNLRHDTPLLLLHHHRLVLHLRGITNSIRIWALA